MKFTEFFRKATHLQMTPIKNYLPELWIWSSHKDIEVKSSELVFIKLSKLKPNTNSQDIGRQVQKCFVSLSKCVKGNKKSILVQ